MRVSVTRTGDGGPESSTMVDLHPGLDRPALLPHRLHLGAGVDLDVELTEACPWRSSTFPTSSESARAFVASVLGPRALDPPGSGGWASAVLDGPRARRLLRVGVVDALDRWVQLPTDRALLDAERAVARLRTAAVLADGKVRRDLVATALALARRAVPGFTLFLDGLARCPAVAPALRDGLDELVRGYAALARRVDGPDADLASVAEAWAEHRPGLVVADADGGRLVLPVHRRGGEPVGPGRSAVDPRQSWARTFGLCAAPDRTEVALAPTASGDAVTVWVPAFGSWVARDVLSRLMVRVVDSRSGAPAGHALLAPTGRRDPVDGSAEMTATVPLYGLDPAAVRADVFDVLVVGSPAAGDADPALRDVRRAVAALARWRQVLGWARMPGRPEERGPQLRAALGDLGELAPPSHPPAAGTPSDDGLRALASSDDEALVARLCALPEPGDPADDACRLTVAELAAADAQLAY